MANPRQSFRVTDRSGNASSQLQRVSRTIDLSSLGGTLGNVYTKSFFLLHSRDSSPQRLILSVSSAEDVVQNSDKEFLVYFIQQLGGVSTSLTDQVLLASLPTDATEIPLLRTWDNDASVFVRITGAAQEQELNVTVELMSSEVL